MNVRQAVLRCFVSVACVGIVLGLGGCVVVLNPLDVCPFPSGVSGDVPDDAVGTWDIVAYSEDGEADSMLGWTGVSEIRGDGTFRYTETEGGAYSYCHSGTYTVSGSTATVRITSATYEVDEPIVVTGSWTLQGDTLRLSFHDPTIDKDVVEEFARRG